MTRLLLASALGALFVASGAFAQTAAERAAAQAEEIARRNASANKAPVPAAPAGEQPSRPAASGAQASGNCLPIGRIDVKGVRLLRAGQLDKAKSGFEGRCLGITELNAVLQSITFAYIDKGYIAARPYLPEQDLSDGQLEVVVVEGALEGIEMPEGTPQQVATAFPGMVGKPVNLRDVEQGLDQIRRLPSVDASMELQAGQEQGGSVLAVDRRAGRSVYGSFGVDNQGGAATGEFQTRLSLGVDDLLGLNDRLSLSYQRSMADTPFNFDGRRPFGDTYTASWDVPYGYWTFGLNATKNEYRSEVAGAVSTIKTSGNSQSYGATASRVLHRNQISKTTLSFGLTQKATESFIAGTRIEVASRRLSIASLSLGHSRQLAGGQLSASLGLQKGLTSFDAFDDRAAPAGSPKGQFRKITYSLGYTKPFEIAGQKVVYDGALSGQGTPDLLFGSEQMSVGGLSSVRGVASAVLFGNHAIKFRNELSLPLAKHKDANMARLFGSFEPYVALDVGKVAAQSQFGIQGGTLSGAAIGLRNRGGKIALDISYADVLRAPAHLPNLKSEPGVWSASLSVSF